MLYSQTQFARDQLLTDLLAVKERLNKAWLKGGFQRDERVCIVAAAQLVTAQPIGFTHVPAATESEGQVRLGRALVAIYMALYGPKAPQDLTLSAVMSKIASFNDGAATKPSVMLLLDRAVAYVLDRAGATVTASA